MGYTLSTTRNLQVAGKTIKSQESVTDNLIVGNQTLVPKAQPGVVTSGAGTTSGNMTMNSGSHGITTGAKVDVYWAGGFRANVTVGTVSGTTVPLTASGTGSNLPANTTPIAICICDVIGFPATGNNVQALAIGIDDGDTECIASFMAADGTTVIWSRHLAAGQGGDFWSTLSAWSNPLAGATAATCRVSHNDITIPHNMNAVGITH